jgi:glycosyltransferase involved in cell wall biosynthesis
MFWIKPSVEFLISYLEQNPVDAIITTAPPHSCSLIGLRLKQHFGNKIKWIADFQDPWTQVDYYQRLHLTSWADKKHHQLEQEVFKWADAITIVSNTWKTDLESIGAKNVEVIPLGFDKIDFQNITPNIDDNFTITHAGLLGDDRHPKVLLKVFSRMTQKYPQFGEKAKLQLAGQVHDIVFEDAKKLGISNMIDFKGEMSKQQVNQLNANSQMLLLLLNKAENAKGRVPGKFFEYLALNRPILCLGERGSDVEQIIHNHQIGECFDYEEEESVFQFIEKKWLEFLQNGTLLSLNQSFEHYTSEQVSKRFVKILDSI